MQSKKVSKPVRKCLCLFCNQIKNVVTVRYVYPTPNVLKYHLKHLVRLLPERDWMSLVTHLSGMSAFIILMTPTQRYSDLLMDPWE